MSAHQSRSASTGLSTENRHEVIETIANYAPGCLSATRWSHCADAVRAAVAAAKPPTVKHARLWLTHLCQFLSSPCGWDGTVTPDLAALLTEATIRAYGCNSRGAGNAYTTACNRRNNLRRIARASGWLAPTSTPFAKTTTTALRAELLAAAKQPLPVAAIAQAWESRNNRVLPEAAFRPVVAALLVTSDVNATPPSGGTFWSPASMRVLAKATDQMVKGCEASVKKPNPTGALTAAGKKLSRRAVLRHAKANLAAGKAHRDGPTLTDPPQQDSVPDDVATAIEAYQPEKRNRDTWAGLAEMTRRLTLGYGPPTPDNAGSTATHVSAFLRWFTTWPGRENVNAPLNARELLTPGLVEIYLPFAPGSSGSRATQRAVLRRALRSLDGSAPASKMPYRPVSTPYTPAECARFVALARHQPTLGRKRNMAFMVGLGLGAGLDGRDLKTVTRDDLVEVGLDPTTTILMVTVTGGREPRTVPVRAGYDVLVREGLTLHDQCGRGPRAVLLGQDTTRDHVTSPVTERAVHADVTKSVNIDASRLRNTWVVAAMCANVPMADLLRAAGLRSARTISDLLPFCPDADPEVITAALAVMLDTVTKTGKNS